MLEGNNKRWLKDLRSCVLLCVHKKYVFNDIIPCSTAICIANKNRRFWWSFSFRQFYFNKGKRCRCWCNKIYWLPPHCKKRSEKHFNICSLGGKLRRHVHINYFDFYHQKEMRDVNTSKSIKRQINRNLFKEFNIFLFGWWGANVRNHVFTLHCTTCNKISACTPK